VQRGDALQTVDETRTLHVELLEARRQIRRLEQSLVETQRLATVGELASRMAHEFNNILMMIMGRAENALKSDSPKSKDEALQKAVACSQRGADIVRGLLVYARGRQTQSQLIAADSLMETAVGLIAWDLKKVGIDLVRQYDTQQPVNVVPGSMEQVLLNLMLNARAAINGQGGRMTVSVAEAEAPGYLAFSVQDTGCGIPPEHLDKIFDPFFTTRPKAGHNGGDGGDGGTGLGLSVARDLVRQAGGEIHVASTPGVGAIFTVLLPAAE
jgi:signal transduction histidine kinase